jgi:hypothetical protein
MNTNSTTSTIVGHLVTVPPGIITDDYINARLKKMIELPLPSTVQYSRFLREWRPWSADSEYTSYKRVYFDMKVLNSKDIELVKQWNRRLDGLLQEEFEKAYRMDFDWR